MAYSGSLGSEYQLGTGILSGYINYYRTINRVLTVSY